MDHDINQYLAKVFRNESYDAKSSVNSQPNESSQKVVEDQIARKFLIEKKYSLGLDEII